MADETTPQDETPVDSPAPDEFAQDGPPAGVPYSDADTTADADDDAAPAPEKNKGGRPPNPKVGDMVRILLRGESLPFMVTHVDGTTVSGVGFSGRPAAVSWSRGGMEFSKVEKGDGNREWSRPDGDV